MPWSLSFCLHQICDVSQQSIVWQCKTYWSDRWLVQSFALGGNCHDNKPPSHQRNPPDITVPWKQYWLGDWCMREIFCVFCTDKCRHKKYEDRVQQILKRTKSALLPIHLGRRGWGQHSPLDLLATSLHAYGSVLIDWSLQCFYDATSSFGVSGLCFQLL